MKSLEGRPDLIAATVQVSRLSAVIDSDSLGADTLIPVSPPATLACPGESAHGLVGPLVIL